jgi:hypothetical protein
MHPDTAAHEQLEQEVRANREREEDAAFQQRYSSEREDREFIRQALGRGFSEEEIESRLAMTTRFVQVYPGRDARAYVRGLVDEEKGSFHALSGHAPPALEEAPPPRVQKDHAGEESPAQAQDPKPGPANGLSRAQASEAAVRQYVNENFERNDWLAVLVLNRKTGETLQRVSPASRIASPEYQSWLRYKNAQGSEIYASLNTFKEHAPGRTKGDLQTIRHVYLDLDERGPEKVAAIRADHAVPAPNYVLNTSPGKFQVIWRVEGIGQDEAEVLLRALVQRFGGDPAATDSTRVFRLPGFSNKKYDEDFQVTIRSQAAASQVYHGSDFAVEVPGRNRSETPSAPARESSSPGQATQSEKDWAYAIRKLKAGEDPEQIIRDMASYRTKDRYDKKDSAKLIAPAKARPYYYAEHTVTQAMAYLGMTKRPTPAASSAASSAQAEIEPSR